ncbi:hypothetical protein D915_000637 [Fasciola hepatica]|uniref:Uncharacterized protein n=1 Tax=Fasciola hepatica TaxID=6192 RepID=A0A4E0S430_FASHE|nr:hypothetical protein D915_000637 [Fasciola hepatica]
MAVINSALDHFVNNADASTPLNAATVGLDSKLKKWLKTAGLALLNQMDQIHFVVDLDYKRKYGLLF